MLRTLRRMVRRLPEEATLVLESEGEEIEFRFRFPEARCTFNASRCTKYEKLRQG